MRHREAAVRRVDLRRRCHVAQVERVIEAAALRELAPHAQEARLPRGHDVRERHALALLGRRGARLHLTGHELLLIERHVVRELGAELAGHADVRREREDAHRAVDARLPPLRVARDDEPADRLRQQLVVGHRAGDRQRHERGRRGARHEGVLARGRLVLPVVAVGAGDRRCGEIVEQPADRRVDWLRAAVEERVREVRAAPVREKGAVLLELRERHRPRGRATGRRERSEQ